MKLVTRLTFSQMIDYDAARSKVRKLTDKPSEDPTKLPAVSE
jgi:bridging integrator 3